jgi:integrase
VRDAGAFAGSRERLPKLRSRLEEFPVDALCAPHRERQKIALPLGDDRHRACPRRPLRAAQIDVSQIAAEWGVIGSAPRFAKLKTRQTEIEFFDFDDFERLVDGARKVDPAVLAFVLLAGEAGLRRGEIIALDLTDADFRRGQLTIARSDWYGQIGTTKGGKTRRVPMTTRLAAVLQAIRHLRGPKDALPAQRGASQ